MSRFSFSNPKDLDARLKRLDAHHGGEGSVYNDHQHLAIKIFNPKEVNVARKERKVKKLIQQSKMVNFNEVITPLEPVTVNGHFVGYTMRFVKDAVDLNHTAEKTFMGEKDLKDCLRLMIKVAQCVEKIHNIGMIIGDFHPGQILVSNGDIFFVDTDSWGWRGRGKEFAPDLKCLPFYVDPRSRDFASRDVSIKYYSKASDYFSLAVIAFKVLTGEHPFGGVYQIDTKMSTEMRARNQLSVLGEHDIKIMKGKTWEAWMTDELKQAFLDIFERGKRFNIESALTNQLMELQYCKRHKGYYNNAYKNCPVCDYRSGKNGMLTTRNSFDDNLFLSNTEIKKVYDYRTYLNKVGEVVRVNERGEEIRRDVKGFGKKETYFLDDERYMIKIKPLNCFQKLSKSGNVEDSCYVRLYKDETEIYKIFVSNRASVRLCGNCLFYVESNTHTLKKVTVLNGDVKETDIAKKQTDFEYVATTNSKYAIISKHHNGIEIDIDGNCTVIPGQRPLIMKYDAISNMWIWVSKVSKTKYNTIVFRRGKKVHETTDITYDSMNLQGSVFHRATLCLAGDGKMISVMPYVANMPISKVITETMISIISRSSTLELKPISESRSELYVLNTDNNVYKFVM